MTPMRSLLRWVWSVSFVLLAVVSSSAAAAEVQAVKQLDTSAMLGDWKVVKYKEPPFGFLGKLFASLPDPKECKKANVKYESVDAGFKVTFYCPVPVPGKSPATKQYQVKYSDDSGFPGKLTWWFLRADRPHWVLMQTDRYLVIGGPKRWSLMILSRDGQLTSEEEAAINGKLQAQGYNTAELVAFGS